jgi:hypothetical protein
MARPWPVRPTRPSAAVRAWRASFLATRRRHSIQSENTRPRHRRTEDSRTIALAPRVKKNKQGASARASQAPAIALPPSLRPIVDAVVDMVFQRLAREREGTPPAPQTAPRSQADASGRAKRKPRKGNAPSGSSHEGRGDTQTELVGALADLLLSDLTRTTSSPKPRSVAKTRSKKTGVQASSASSKRPQKKR